MKKKLFIIAGIINILIGVILLCEGKLTISTKSLAEIKEIIQKRDPCTIISDRGKENIRVVYCLDKNKQTAYVYELYRNPMLNRYSIKNRHEYPTKWYTAGGVISSPLYNYVFNVNMYSGYIK